MLEAIERGDDSSCRVKAENEDVVLYHVTLAKRFAEIARQGAIKPSVETGARTWRNPSESGEERNKIYLATREMAPKIAEKLQDEYGGSVYILEVRVNGTNLVPDEDTGAENWTDSLDTYFQSCAHYGSIDNFDVADKLDFDLPRDERSRFAHRTLHADSQEERDRIMAEYDTMVDEGRSKEEVR